MLPSEVLESHLARFGQEMAAIFETGLREAVQGATSDVSSHNMIINTDVLSSSINKLRNEMVTFFSTNARQIVRQLIVAAEHGNATCSVCMAETVDQSFGCGHAYCSKCVPQLLASGRCPGCRASISSDDMYRLHL